jgi:hypothetical protein
MAASNRDDLRYRYLRGLWSRVSSGVRTGAVDPLAAAQRSSLPAHHQRARSPFRALAAQAVANYREKEWQHLCKALCRISLADEPITSRHAVRQTVRGCGEKVDELLREIDESRGSAAPPARGTYVGAAAALLVALLEATELQESAAAPGAKDVGVVSKEALIDACAACCGARASDRARDHWRIRAAALTREI